MKTKELELYVHIPFCIQKCNYCDFCSFQASETTVKLYMEKLYQELEQWGNHLDGDRKISTIFIGGGTPSSIDAVYIQKLCQIIRQSFSVMENAEVTIEANPGTVDAENLRMYYDAGISRISFGLQSTRQEELSYLGRIHTYEEFLESYYDARKAGFENINVDLMSAIPKQTIKSYEETLRNVAELKPEHISAYSLIIEEGTRFAQDESIGLYLPSEEDEVSMYKMTGEILVEYGYEKYEISNYAKPGYECIHNLGYWSQIPYLGVGLNAASYLDEKRFENSFSMNEYLATDYFPKVFEETKPLTLEAQIEEFMFLGLRKTKGVSRTEFRQKFHQPMNYFYRNVIEKAIGCGWMQEKDDMLSLTEKGILISNQVLCEFLLEV